MSKEITIKINPERIRQLMNKQKETTFGTDAAEAFILLHGSKLEAQLDATLVSFVRSKLS